MSYYFPFNQGDRIMHHIKLPDYVWDKIYNFLCQQENVYTKNQEKTRQFIEDVLWMMRSGAPWRFLPSGDSRNHWNSVYRRYVRWVEKGIWDALHAHFANDPDLESVMLDGTVVRAHACAAGAPQHALDEPQEQALGYSKGGFSTKIHVMVDALGNPLDFVLTAGQAAEVKQAYTLLEGVQATYALMDKAYDSDELREQLRQQGIIPVIPPRANRKYPAEYDKHIYKERHLVECLIGKLKHFRRVFSRFDKWAKNYMGFIRFAATLVWLR
jgi:transposase